MSTANVSAEFQYASARPGAFEEFIKFIRGKASEMEAGQLKGCLFLGFIFRNEGQVQLAACGKGKIDMEILEAILNAWPASFEKAVKQAAGANGEQGNVWN